MTQKCHVPFWRAVGKVTSSLTLIIKKVGLELFPTIKRRKGKPMVVENPLTYENPATYSTLKEVLKVFLPKMSEADTSPEGECP